MPRPAQTGGKPPRPGRLFAGLALCVLAPSLATSSANVALPTLAQHFHSGFAAAQWVVLAYLLTTTSLLVGAGRLGDRFGPRRLLRAGLLLFGLAAALCSVAPGLPSLLAARALQGLAAALLLSLALALASAQAGGGGVAPAVGLLGGMSALGTALGPALGGWLLSAFGWPAIFLLGLPLSLAALLLLRGELPPDPAPAPGGPLARALPGLLLLAAALCSYALALTLEKGRFGLLSGGLLLAAVILAGLLLWREARTGAAFLDLAALREPGLTAALAASALVSTVLMATLVVGPFYLTQGLHLPQARLGLVLSAGPLLVALASQPAGRLTSRLGAPRLTLAGLLILLAGALLLAARPGGSLPGYLLPVLVLTLGYALFQTANNAGVMQAAAADQRGLLAGLLNLSRNLGLISGTALMGAVYNRSAASGGAGQGLQACFGLAGLLLLAALGALWLGARLAARPAPGRPGPGAACPALCLLPACGTTDRQP